MSNRNLLIESLPKYTIGAELGVWKGNFSIRLLETNPQRLYLIDPWVYRPDYPSSLYGHRTMNQARMDRIYKGILRRFSSDDRVVVLRTQEGLRSLPEMVDWVYIDGDHNYPAVQRDLREAALRVKDGGLICGDDYAQGGWWGAGVVNAVDEFIQDHQWPATFIGNQYLIRKGNYGNHR